MAILRLRPQEGLVLDRDDPPKLERDRNSVEDGAVGDDGELFMAVARWENEGGAVGEAPQRDGSQLPRRARPAS